MGELKHVGGRSKVPSKPSPGVHASWRQVLFTYIIFPGSGPGAGCLEGPILLSVWVGKGTEASPEVAD